MSRSWKSSRDARWAAAFWRPAAAALLCPLSLAVPARAQAPPPVSETPRFSNAALYQPCQWELGDLTGPLKTLALSQQYTYFEYANTTGPRPGGTLPATLDNLASIGTNGLVEIATHANDSHLLAEAYRLNDFGAVGVDDDGDGTVDEPGEARDVRLKGICDGTILPGGLRLTCPADVGRFSGIRMVRRGGYDVSEPQDYGIGLTKVGIGRFLAFAPHAIVFVGACHSWALRDAFLTVPLEFFGYLQEVQLESINKDSSLLFRRLAGSDGDGRLRRAGGHTGNGGHDGSCSAFGRSAGYSRILRNAGTDLTTVAPSLHWGELLTGCTGGHPGFFPGDNTTLRFNGELVDIGYVSFDTVMDTSINPIGIITTDGGCGSTIQDAVWMDSHTIQFTYRLRSNSGNLRFTVNEAQAKSAWNNRELDGNQNPNPFTSNAVGPNRDHFVSRCNCAPPSLAASDGDVAQASRRHAEPSLDGQSGPNSPQVNILTLTVADAPVGAPGDTAFGALSLSSNVNSLVVTLSATSLVSGGNVIPAGRISIDPDTLVSSAVSSSTIDVMVDVPPGQPIGTYTGTVTARSGATVSSCPLQVVVNTPPAIFAPTSQVVTAGSLLSFAITTADADGDSVHISTSLLPDGAVLIDHRDGTGEFQFTPSDEDSGMSTGIVLVASNTAPGGIHPPMNTATVALTVLGRGVAGSGDPPDRLPGLTLTASPNPATSRGTSLLLNGGVGDVSIEVFDLAGRLVREFKTSASSAPSVNVYWDGRARYGEEAPSGIYLVRAVRGGAAVVTRIVLVR